MSLWGLGIGQQNVGNQLSQQQAAANLQAQTNAAHMQNYSQQPLGGLGPFAQPLPTWNENVPLWSEGGYEAWLGKPAHSVAYCQRCLFL
jgi:hypothetical protein